jgi:acid phosphatase
MNSRCALLGFLLGLTACGGNGTSGGNNGGTGGGGATTPALQHVVIVVLENQDYSDVVGNPALPYFNSLATQYSLATQFYANAHPSIGNYFEMTTAQNPTGNLDAWPLTFGGDNVARELTAQNKTWRVYAQSLPGTGYTGDDVYPYVKHHNPFAYFDDVINSAAQKANILGIDRLATDATAGSLPTYSFVIPDDIHNGHDCPAGTLNCPPTDRLSAADTFLNNTLSALIDNPTLMANTAIIVTFDESATDNTLGGGRIPVVIVGGKIKTGYQSTTTYQFPSLLRFSLESVGITSYPGSAGSAASMNEFFK